MKVSDVNISIRISFKSNKCISLKSPPDMMRSESCEKLADDEGRGAENVESDDDQGQLDGLDLGPGNDL